MSEVAVIMKKKQFGGAMCVRIDDQRNPQSPCPFAMDPVEVEPQWVGIDLDHRAVLERCLENDFEIHLVALAAQQQSPRRVSEHGHARMTDGLDDAGRHFLLCLFFFKQKTAYEVPK